MRSGFKRSVELDLPEFTAKRRLRQLGDRERVIIDTVARQLGIDDAQIHNSVYADLNVVARNALLFGNIDDLFLQRVALTDLIHERNQDVRAGIESPIVAA